MALIARDIFCANSIKLESSCYILFIITSPPGGGGGGGGVGYSDIFVHTYTRLGSFLGVQNFEFQYFCGFSEK